MELKLKSIEEKLDIIIAAMSVNPEFSSFVKEGLLNIKIEKAKNEYEIENYKRKILVREFFAKTLNEFSIQFENPFSGIKMMGRIGFSAKNNAPLYAVESISEFAKLAEENEWNFKQIELDCFVERLRFEKDFCPAFKDELSYRFGKELNLEEEIERIKQQTI